MVMVMVVVMVMMVSRGGERRAGKHQKQEDSGELSSSWLDFTPADARRIEPDWSPYQIPIKNVRGPRQHHNRGKLE